MDIRNLPGQGYKTLFLDRDGVINKRLIGDYVKSWKEFEFLPGVLDAFKDFAEIFDRIIIVTNQQGIGKELMSASDLHAIHTKMVGEIERKGGKVDAIYFCPALASAKSPDRKPEPGMALQAMFEFPEIQLNKSIMVGDSISDMVFGRNTGMRTVLTVPSLGKSENIEYIDYICEGLLDFAMKLK